MQAKNPPIVLFLKKPGWTSNGTPNGSYYASYIYNELPPQMKLQIGLFFLDDTKPSPQAVTGYPQVFVMGTPQKYGENTIRWLLLWAAKNGIFINMGNMHPSAARFTIRPADTRGGSGSSDHRELPGHLRDLPAPSDVKVAKEFGLSQKSKVTAESTSVLHSDMLQSDKWHDIKPDSKAIASVVPDKKEETWLYELADDGKHDIDSAHLAVWDFGSSVLDESDGVGVSSLGTTLTDYSDRDGEEDDVHIETNKDGGKMLKPRMQESSKSTAKDTENYIAMREKHQKELEARMRPPPGATTT